ncbi:GntR family transcriptional regulator [Rhodococcus sp. KRD162]|uniref:GntR family transcriptional regulator n=1 Tax=unclassified Rhodococcus (in: high G+C Gram-positive bacteria) TaxID=192944 RepID=UPI0019D0C6CD|nr:GntR family transcriptional regulator [Rhodococcus sp. KRD162]
MVTPTSVFSSKGEVAYVELRRSILLGTLDAGSKLAQYELADRLNMSITPIREAVRRLSSEGLIELDNHKNVRIAPMSTSEARQLFEVRLSLDPTAVELAAARRTDQDVANMRAAAERLLPVTQTWGEDELVAHRNFHRALYVASHNDVLIRMLDDLWDKSDRYRRIGLELPSGAQPRSIDHEEHFRMLELVVAQDARAAGALTRRHIVESFTSAAIAALEDRERKGRQHSA